MSKLLAGAIDKIRIFSTQLQMRGAPKAAILMYHCVAKSELDPWNLSVTPERFAEHLEIIQQQAVPMSLRDLAAAQRSGNVPNRAVAVTFDDGYANNLYQAKPLLNYYQIPATVFVATGSLGSAQGFWWDELAQALLTPGTLPETLSLTIDQQLKCWHLGDAATYSDDDYQQDRHRNAWEGKANSRLAFYYSVWEALKNLSANQQQLLQAEILTWAGAQALIHSDYRALTHAELTALAQDGSIEIGAHTVTHPSLPAHDAAFQQAEIKQSKQTLEQILPYPITSFAYPFGDLNQASIAAVEASGFEQACSTVQKGVWKKSDRFQLPRIEVQNWDKETFQANFIKWLE